jgi:hypothetical protein
VHRIPRVAAGCLTFALALSMCASASTCTIGTSSSPTGCQISADDGLFTWTLSNIQVTVANVNVTPSVLSLNAVSTAAGGVDQLQLVQQVTPPSGSALTNGMPLILDLNFDLSVTPTPPSVFRMPRTPAPPDNSELQTYLNGLLLATISSHGYVLGSSGVDGTFLNQGTTVAVNDIFIVDENSGANTFSETFDIADPEDTKLGAPSAPEPASLAFLGLAAILACLSGLSPQVKRLFSRKLMLVTHHDLFKNRRKIVG